MRETVHIEEYFGTGGQDSRSVVTADLDGNGSLDVATVSVFSDAVSVLLNVTAPLPGDLDRDGDIDWDDYNAFRESLGQCEEDAAYNSAADYDGDGCVSYADYRTWLGYYRNQ